MADSLLYGLAGDILKRVTLIIEKEIVLVAGVQSELNKFAKTLSTIKAVLLDAEERPKKSNMLTNWLERINDVCSDAEDMLDEFDYEISRRQVFAQRSFATKVCKFFSLSELKFRSKISHKLEKIKERLDEIAADQKKFELNGQHEVGRVMPAESRETDPFVPISEFIGRRDDIDRIFELLNRRVEENVAVIPIVGMGGLGKTTLVKLLCDDERVVDRFQMRIRVGVSQDFNIKMTAKEIIISAGDKDCGDLKWEDLETRLRETLKDKRFLLILDNVWNVDRETWLALKAMLKDGANGSGIIVTTRHEAVASVVCTTPGHIYNLRGLPPQDCLTLFVNLAFRKGEDRQYPKLLDIVTDIVQKCGGVPLAVRTLGGLLFHKRDIEYWEKVKNSEIGRLEQTKTDISPVLRLSYDCLPFQMQKCFAFCSMFPKHYKLNSLELIRLWTAQGLIKPSDGNLEFEYIGRQYILELSSRSFFQNVEEHDDVLTFEMHDLMHDLALLVAQATVSPLGTIYSKGDRRVSFTKNLPSKDLPTENNLRTIFRPNGGAICEFFAKTCISRCKYLRVLDLRDLDFDVLPSSIGKLYLLRYLNLYNSSIKELPSSICNLLNLQTLDISKCQQLEELPRDIGKLINLRCLYITTKQIRFSNNEIGCLKSLQFLGIVGCCNLTCLGEGIQRLTALQTLLIGDCNSLESLPMKHLTTLKTLFIFRCESLNLMEGEEDIQGLGLGLRSSWIAGLPRLEALPKWLQGAANTLQNMCIGDCRNLTALPKWLQDFTSLQKLEIEDCPKLSALPEAMYSSPALKLKITNCPELPKKSLMR